MVVLDQAEDPLAERERLSELIFEFSLKHNIVISVLPVAEHALEKRQKPLFLNVRQEGITI